MGIRELAARRRQNSQTGRLRHTASPPAASGFESKKTAAGTKARHGFVCADELNQRGCTRRKKTLVFVGSGRQIIQVGGIRISPRWSNSCPTRSPSHWSAPGAANRYSAPARRTAAFDPAETPSCGASGDVGRALTGHGIHRAQSVGGGNHIIVLRAVAQAGIGEGAARNIRRHGIGAVLASAVFTA